MNSLLITGGTEEERIKRAKELVVNYKISQFDTYDLQPELSIGIAQIRELERWLNLKPYQSAKKAAIIFQAEKLTIEAQNALLKSLEEPPDKTFIILLSPNTDVLLPTIVSRCQIINLSTKPQVKLTEKEISQYLNILISLFKSDIGEKLKLAQEISKSREEASDFLDKEITVLESLLKDKALGAKARRYPDMPICRYLLIIREFQKTKGLIQANTNMRLALENLFLSFG